MLALNPGFDFRKGQQCSYMNIVSAVALFAPLSARLEILWQVFLLIWIHTSSGFLLWYPGCHCCCFSYPVGAGCPYLLGIPPRQCCYRALLPRTSGNSTLFCFLGATESDYGRTTACVFCILLASNKQVCIAPKVENTVKYVHRPDAVFGEQARLLTNCFVFKILSFTFVFTTDNNSNPRLRELWNLTLMSHVRTLKPCFG